MVERRGSGGGGGPAQEAARRYQVSVALGVREGVARAPRAGAADARAPRQRLGRGLGLSHLEHHLWAHDRQRGRALSAALGREGETFVWLAGRYLVVDGGTQLDQQEAVGDHGENAQRRGEEHGQPHARLVQGVPRCSWTESMRQKKLVSKPGVGKLWPGGHAQPATLFNPAHSNLKKFYESSASVKTMECYQRSGGGGGQHLFSPAPPMYSMYSVVIT